MMPANDLDTQNPTPTAQAISSKRLDIALFTVVTVMIGLVLVMLLSNIVLQHLNYKSGIDSALAESPSVDHAAVITYSRAWDSAVIKTSSVFLSVLVILLGSLYVLRVARYDTRISADTGFFRGAFSTTSPGLTMVLLGVILAVAALNYKSNIEYKRERDAECQFERKPLSPDTSQ